MLSMDPQERELDALIGLYLLRCEAEGKSPETQPTTLSALIALYLARCRIEGLSPRTQRAYSETLARFQRSVAAQGVPDQAAAVETATVIRYCETFQARRTATRHRYSRRDPGRTGPGRSLRGRSSSTHHQGSRPAAGSIEEFFRAAPPSRPSVVGVNMIGPILITHGSIVQREQHLPPIAHGEVTWCEGMTEPTAGSDLASLQAVALREGDAYVVNGQRVWTSWAHEAHRAFLLARSDRGAPKHRGLSMFLLDLQTPGVAVRLGLDMAGDSMARWSSTRRWRRRTAASGACT